MLRPARPVVAARLWRVLDRRSKLPHVLFALHSVLATLCVVGPGYKWWGASAKPFVLGLPFSLAWAIGWLISVFVSLLLYERWTRFCEDARGR